MFLKYVFTFFFHIAVNFSETHPNCSCTYFMSAPSGVKIHLDKCWCNEISNEPSLGHFEVPDQRHKRTNAGKQSFQSLRLGKEIQEGKYLLDWAIFWDYNWFPHPYLWIILIYSKLYISWFEYTLHFPFPNSRSHILCVLIFFLFFSFYWFSFRKMFCYPNFLTSDDKYTVVTRLPVLFTLLVIDSIYFAYLLSVYFHRCG